MKPSHKKKLRKLGHLLIKGGRESSKFVKKYGPMVQHHARSISESTMDVMRPRTGYVDVRKKGEYKRMKQRSEMRTRGGYVDLTAKRKPMRKRLRKINGRAFVDLT